MGLFGRLFGRKKKAKKEVEENSVEKTQKIERTEKKPYVYEVGDKTIYDCIVEAKALGLDMREVDAKLRGMEGDAFIAWFEEYKKDFE